MSDRRDDVLEYLASHHVATLATTGVDGPWASAVFYVNDGLTLEFLSSPRSRHAVNLAEDPRCAAGIQEEYQTWSEIRGVQLEGTVRLLSGSRKQAAMARYEGKFPMIRSDRADAPIRAALERVEWYELIVNRCLFIDNAQGFGQRLEIPIH